MSRDRDATGRPRNARNRDELGRPLPRDAGGHPPGEPPALPPEEALSRGESLLRENRPFYAHEVFEAVWKSSEDEDRDVWRGLAQLAVALTHRQRHNVKGAGALFARAAATLQPWSGQTPHGIAVDVLRGWCADAAVDPETAGDPPPLRG